MKYFVLPSTVLAVGMVLLLQGCGRRELRDPAAAVIGQIVESEPTKPRETVLAIFYYGPDGLIVEEPGSFIPSTSEATREAADRHIAELDGRWTRNIELGMNTAAQRDDVVTQCQAFWDYFDPLTIRYPYKAAACVAGTIIVADDLDTATSLARKLSQKLGEPRRMLWSWPLGPELQ